MSPRWTTFALLLALLGAGCSARPAGSPPELYRSSLLSYRLPPLVGPGTAPRSSGRHLASSSSRTRQQRLRNGVLRAAREELGRGTARAETSPAARQRSAVGFVLRAYASAGHPLPVDSDGDVGSLHRMARRMGYLRGPRKARPADLAFFHHTLDANRNGRLDDELTEVAIVETVDRDGTLHLLHVRHGVVRRMVANPRSPHRRRRGSKVLNSYIRPRRKDDGPRTPYLAGEMLAGLATVIR